MDLYVMQLQDQIPIGSIQNVPETASTPRALIVSGRNFDRVQEFEVNTIQILSGWEQRSDGSVYLPLPAILQKAVIAEVTAFSNTVHDTEASRIVSRIGSGFRVVGLQYTIQLLLRWLFTEPGSDKWYPRAGGGWKSAVSYGTTDDVGMIVSRLSDGLARTVEFIQSLQAQDAGIPRTEILAAAEITHTTKTPRGLRVSLRVKNAAYDKFTVAVRAASR